MLYIHIAHPKRQDDMLFGSKKKTLTGLAKTCG